MSELARVSSERTALQVQVDKQAKAAREEALLGAPSPLSLLRYGYSFPCVLLLPPLPVLLCSDLLSVGLSILASFRLLLLFLLASLLASCCPTFVRLLPILLILIRLFASVARPIVDVMGPEQRRAAQLRHDGAARPGAGMGAGPGRRPGKHRTIIPAEFSLSLPRPSLSWLNMIFTIRFLRNG